MRYLDDGTQIIEGLYGDRDGRGGDRREKLFNCPVHKCRLFPSACKIRYDKTKSRIEVGWKESGISTDLRGCVGCEIGKKHSLTAEKRGQRNTEGSRCALPIERFLGKGIALKRGLKDEKN